MRFSATVSLSFDASHQLAEPERCSKMHGHSWRISVTATEGRITKSAQVPNTLDLPAALDALVSEWDNRHLNDMLPGVVPTTLGVAVYALERLSLSYPGIDQVEVCESSLLCASVRRDRL